MKIAITGASGFLGTNLRFALEEAGKTDIVKIPHDISDLHLKEAVAGADFVYHLAGVNRPEEGETFESGNVDFTRNLITALENTATPPPLVYASSSQAERDNPYGQSKKAAEDLVVAYQKSTGTNTRIYRLTNIFGKWCRPNYNSVIATFCHNISQGLPVTVNDRAAPLKLVYIDDVVKEFMSRLTGKRGDLYGQVTPVYETTLGAIHDKICAFHEKRENIQIENVGTGLTRALYATYASYLTPGQFSYTLQSHADQRGRFVEMLKTPDCGQLSFFTARPGVTRGGHYHHTKIEKFLIIQGTGKFCFENIKTGDTHELAVAAENSRIVETVPGWSHDITNIGEDELIVMLWANEVFDPENPDTIARPLNDSQS